MSSLSTCVKTPERESAPNLRAFPYIYIYIHTSTYIYVSIICWLTEKWRTLKERFRCSVRALFYSMQSGFFFSKMADSIPTDFSLWLIYGRRRKRVRPFSFFFDR